MPNSQDNAEIKDELADPSRVFPKPMDVVSAASLSREEKTKILDAMEHDARELSTATAENMGGGETAALDDVLDAKRRLEGHA